MTEVAVIVVAYHNADLLERCLAALPPHLPVWVVDNSSDSLVETTAGAHGATYVDTGENLGFASGVNTGLRLVPEDHDVLLLNPDAELSADGLNVLQASLHSPKNDRVAAVSPSVIDPATSQRQRVAWPLPTPGRMWREALGLHRWAPPQDEYVIGAVLLLRRAAIDDVGPFDERFFLYAEEADWQRRARRRGWRMEEVPSAQAMHIGAGTSSDESRRDVLFHAGMETYVRKWYGPVGWLSYRAAAVFGALLRSIALRDGRGAAARARARLYARGPRRTAILRRRASSAGLRITHIVVTDAFAGVERYVSEVASEQAARGADVTVVGGHPVEMPARLGSARFRPAASLLGALREVARAGRQDVVHAHLTAAELVALFGKLAHGAPVIATRHIARRRGSSWAARTVGQAVRRCLAMQIATSQYVARVIGEPATVLWNAVRSMPEAAEQREPVVLILQRLEPEKNTDLAIRAWAKSELAAEGWQLRVAGSGSQLPTLEALAARLRVRRSVRFLGHVQDTQALLRSCGLLMATGSSDAFGLSVAEAMALGTPVLASDGGAHGELLGPSGRTFPVGDAGAAAVRLRELALSSAQVRRGYGQALRARQQRFFDLDRHIERLADLYYSVMHRRKASAVDSLTRCVTTSEKRNL